MSKEPSKLSQYVDPSGDFSTKEFTLGYWYVQHKLLLRKIFIWILLSWSIITIGIGLIVWGHYLFVGYWEDEQLLASHIGTFQNYSAIQPAYEAQPLSYDQSRLFKSADGRYDFFTLVRNPNEDFVAYVTFHYVYANVETARQTQAVLPRLEQGLVVYGHETLSYPAQAQLIIDEIRWQRINPHVVFDPSSYMAERLRFRVSDFEFIRPGGEEPTLTNALSFGLHNESVYSYWDASFHVLLKRGEAIVGVIPLSETQFRAGESRDVDIFTFAELTQVDSIEVLPTINVFDTSAFISVGE
jgi:hypothetical protein